MTTEDAPQGDYPLREVFNGQRWMARIVYQRLQHWRRTVIFEAIVHHLRAVSRIVKGCRKMLLAAIFENWILQSTVESGERAGREAARRKGNRAHLMIDTLATFSHCVTAADEQDRAQGAEIAERMQAETGEIAYVD